MPFTRKETKRYPEVEFTTSYFEEKFVLPRFNSLPLGVIRRVTQGDFNRVVEFLEENGYTEQAEAIDSLSMDEEFEGFFDFWTEAEDIPAPKSSK